MPKDGAHEGAEVLSFATAPPNNAEIAHTRFKGSRNLPYKEAEPYKSSLYYWWWAFCGAINTISKHAKDADLGGCLVYTKILATFLRARF